MTCRAINVNKSMSPYVNGKKKQNEKVTRGEKAPFSKVTWTHEMADILTLLYKIIKL